MTLGCGGWGGNITSDNISPRHLLNIKRLAYEVHPAAPSAALAQAEAGEHLAPGQLPDRRPLPRPPARAAQARGIPADALSARIDAFLASRGYRPEDASGLTVRSTGSVAPAGDGEQPRLDLPAEFVCEDDVRSALRAGRQIVVSERTIVTPAARDLGESHRVFVDAGFPR
jgi:acetaldehyde dehydrogenase (acetylating)